MDEPRRGWASLLAIGFTACLVGAGGLWVALNVEPGVRPRLPRPGSRLSWVHAGVTPWVWIASGLSVPLWAWLARRAPTGRRSGAASAALHLVLVLLVVLGVSRAFQRAVTGRWDGPVVGLPTLLAWSLPVWIVVLVVRTRETMDASRRREVESERLRAQLAEARSQALASKLRPHFLFNTLQGISTQIHARPEAADRMLGHLGRLLRDSLELEGSDSHPLREELAALEPFVAIAKQRFGDRFRYEQDVDEVALDVDVPVYLLQPLVENAIEHGVARKVGKGAVRVTGRIDSQAIRLEVVDDGPGLDENGVGAGFGLRSVRERLRERRGELRVEEADGGGVCARITLPRDGASA